MSANPFRANIGAGDFAAATSGVERRPESYQLPPEEDKEEEARLRKKFRGKLPKEIIEAVNKDTFYDHTEQALRKRLHSLISTNLQTVRRDPAAFFRDEATDISRLLRDDTITTSFIRTILWDFVTEFSAQTPHLASVVAVVASGGKDFGARVLESWSSKFKAALRDGQGIAARLLLRFLGELVASSVLHEDALVAQYTELCKCLEPDSKLASDAQDYLAYLMTSSLLWCGAFLAVSDAKPMDVILTPLRAYIERRGVRMISGCAPVADAAAADTFAFPDITSTTPFAGGANPAPPVPDVLSQAWDAVNSMLSKGDCIIDAIARPSSRVLNAEVRARITVRDFTPVVVPDDMPAGYIRQPLILFGAGSFTSPKFLTMLGLDRATPADLFCLREVIDDTLATYHPFHNEVATALLFNTQCEFPVAPFIIERALCQIVDPLPYHPPQYYASLLVSLVMKDKSNKVAGTVADLMRAVYKNIALFNEEAAEKLSRWLGWHCSNFGFRWIWNEWVSALSLPELHPQRRFLLSCLYSTFKLIGTLDREDTISAAVPEALLPFVPRPQKPSSQFYTLPSPGVAAVDTEAPDGADPDQPKDVDTDGAGNESEKDPRYEQLMSFLKEKLSDDALAEKLEDTWDSDAERAEAFAHAIMMYSHLNYKNVGIMLDRYKDILKGIGRTKVALDAFLTGVQSVWREFPDVVSVVLNMCVGTGVFRPGPVIAWLLDVPPVRLLAQWRWQSVFALLDIANAAVLSSESVLAQLQEFDPECEEADLAPLQLATARENASAAVRAFCEGLLSAWSSLSAEDGEDDADVDGDSAPETIALLRSVFWSRLRQFVFQYRVLIAKCPASVFDGLYTKGEGGALLSAALSKKILAPVAPCPLLRDKLAPGAF